jgi:hypothetical protein
MSPFWLFVSCSIKKEETGKETLTHSVTLGGFLRCDTTNYIFLKSAVNNISTDTIQCVSMACSWADGYTTDSTDFLVEKYICYSNVPVLVKIPPGKSFDRYIKIITRENLEEWRRASFRVGYNLVVRDTTKQIFDQVGQIGDMKNVIWSDSIKLKELWNF